MRVLLTNYTDQPQHVRVVGLSSGSARVRALDETNIEVVYRSPEVFMSDSGELVSVPDGSLSLTLRPYATIRLDMA